VADPGRIWAIDYGTGGWGWPYRSPADHPQGAGTLENRGDIPGGSPALVSSRGTRSFWGSLRGPTEDRRDGRGDPGSSSRFCAPVCVPVATWEKATRSVDAKSAFLAGA